MNLREALLDLFDGYRKGVDYFAQYCQKIALTYLKSKISSGNYYINEVTADIDDLAWDCIADLFERNERGDFVELETYFSNVKEFSEKEIKIKTRRLVFSKVNDSLFRIFGNYDSSLSKIIRNIKNSASRLDLHISRINTANHIFFDTCQSDNEPLMPQEFLEIKLGHRLSTSMNMVEVMKEVELIFIRQELYRKEFPLIELARVIRRTFVNNHGQKKSKVLPKKPLFLSGELQQFLEDAIDRYFDQFYQTYVSKGKLSESEFEAYTNTIRDILRHKYIIESRIGDGYYENLKEHMPNLSKSEYRDIHRQYLEYMVKLVREEMIRKIKKVV